MRKLFTLLSLLSAMSAANAQSTAVRLIIGEGHKVYTKPAFGNYCMGAGVDRTFNDKLTIGLDATFDVAAGLKAGPVFVQSPTSGIEASLVPHLMSINYHTEYALGDNDGTHLYIGSFLGLRRIKQDWTVTDTRNDGYTEQRTTVSKMLVPVGIRAGLRGTTDGGFMDLYAELGYQIGGGKELRSDALLKGAPYTKTSSLAFAIGLAYGFGW